MENSTTSRFLYWFNIVRTTFSIRNGAPQIIMLCLAIEHVSLFQEDGGLNEHLRRIKVFFRMRHMGSTPIIH